MSRQLVLSLAMKTWGRNEKGGIYMLRTYLKGRVLKRHHIDDRVFDIECSSAFIFKDPPEKKPA